MLLEKLQWEGGWAWQALPGVNIAHGEYDGVEYWHIFDNNVPTVESWYVHEALTAQAILFHLAEKYG
jgi:hypothetical protein